MNAKQKYTITPADIIKGLIPIALLGIILWFGPKIYGEYLNDYFEIVTRNFHPLVLLIIFMVVGVANMATYYFIYHKLCRLKNLNPPNPIDLFLGMKFHVFLLETCKKTENKDLKKLYLMYKLVCGISVLILVLVLYPVIFSKNLFQR